MANELENEQKIKAWARENPKYRRYLSNMAMLSKLYAKHHKPTKIKDCMEGQEAKLTLFVVKLIGEGKVRQCVECGMKPGEKESEKCGVSEFEERTTASYAAGDETGEIMITIPPWYTHSKKMELEEMYLVEGVIKEYEGNLQIQPTEEMTKIDAEDNEVKEALEQIMMVNDGKVKKDIMTAGMQGFDEDEVKEAMEEMGIEEDEEGNWVASKED